MELENLQQQLSKKPDHTPVLLRMAQVAREMGKPAEAAQHLRQALQQEPKNREARLELGRALYETGDIGGAIKETQELLSKDPRDVDALYNLGAIYGNMKQDESARKYWLQAVATAPGSPSGQLAKQGLPAPQP
jgi:Flp pilus assembly protein TadD